MHLSYGPTGACQTLFPPRPDGIPIETTCGAGSDAVDDDGHEEHPPPQPPPEDAPEEGWNVSQARRTM